MKILHVDDEIDIREITQLSLELDPTFDVLSAESGAMALRKMSDFTPDVILLDMMMPDMDGPSLLKILRDRPETANIPIIFMTAAAQRQMVDDLKSLGAIGVISKPFDPMMLGEEVKALHSGVER